MFAEENDWLRDFHPSYSFPNHWEASSYRMISRVEKAHWTLDTPPILKIKTRTS